MSINTNMGMFLPSTYNFDLSKLQSLQNTEVNSDEFRRLIVEIFLDINRMLIGTNLKETGIYDLTEFVNSQLFFPNPNLNAFTAQQPTQRQVYRKVINFGPLPNAGTKSVTHNIETNSGVTFTRIYAVASDTTGLLYIPIPYASATTENIVELSVNATMVNITTNGNLTNYNVCYVILEYLKQ